MKQRSRNTFAWAIVLSTIAHFLFLAYAPPFHAEDFSFGSGEMTAVDLPPPEIEIPPPPQQIARPATPVVTSATIDEDITIAATTFEANPVDRLAAPPTVSKEKAEDIRSAPTFTPMTVKPELLNQAEIVVLLERFYPPMLRDAGIGGDVVVWFFLDTTGKVINTKLSVSSGYPAMDEAALKIAPAMQFRPAKNRDKIVEVWVQIPITFHSR